MKTALELFRSGRDTAEIAHILRISEALALSKFPASAAPSSGKAVLTVMRRSTSP